MFGIQQFIETLDRFPGVSFLPNHEEGMKTIYTVTIGSGLGQAMVNQINEVCTSEATSVPRVGGERIRRLEAERVERIHAVRRLQNSLEAAVGARKTYVKNLTGQRATIVKLKKRNAALLAANDRAQELIDMPDYAEAVARCRNLKDMLSATEQEVESLARQVQDAKVYRQDLEVNSIYEAEQIRMLTSELARLRKELEDPPFTQREFDLREDRNQAVKGRSLARKANAQLLEERTITVDAAERLRVSHEENYEKWRKQINRACERRDEMRKQMTESVDELHDTKERLTQLRTNAKKELGKYASRVSSLESDLNSEKFCRAMEKADAKFHTSPTALADLRAEMNLKICAERERADMYRNYVRGIVERGHTVTHINGKSVEDLF